MKYFLLISVFLFLLRDAFAANFLRVSDPRTSWTWDIGTIENASLTVRPEGLYMEYGLYMTFSARGSRWQGTSDSLEVVLDFDLPENAIVHDSWLWIGDDIVKADIMDKWTASTIYENIVRRRRDPSILSKVSSTQYELRVFPMAANETRKVKITWLMPATWSTMTVNCALPTEILTASRIPPVTFPVVAYPNLTWINPQIIDYPEIVFSAKSDTILGDYFQADIPSTRYSNLNIGFNSPVKDGYYFSASSSGEEGIYQLALFPDILFDSTVVRKTAILVDYDASNTNYTSNELLMMLKNEMLKHLSSRDSFNLIFSNLSVNRYSNKWIASSKENIETAFKSLVNPLSSYSNMASLISNGIDFIKNNGNDGKIILLSDADQYGDFQVANKLINDILALMKNKIQFHISDYQSTNFPYYYIDGQSYQGNSYFYTNLSRITLGSYQNVNSGFSVSNVIGESFKYTSGSLNSFDLHTSVSSGFCYGRHNLSGTNKMVYLNHPILQIGKYKGKFPFSVEISGEFKNKLFSQRIEIQEDQVMREDTMAGLMWTGQYIKDLESGQQQNDVINEIVYHSIENRILSKYTSFLCLEDTNQICYDCIDEEEIIIGLEAKNNDQDSISIYPNPFVDEVIIELISQDPTKITELAIYNIAGMKIYEFELSGIQTGTNQLKWNGADSKQQIMKSGVYLLVYKTANEIKTVKLLKQ